MKYFISALILGIFVCAWLWKYTTAIGSEDWLSTKGIIVNITKDKDYESNIISIRIRYNYKVGINKYSNYEVFSVRENSFDKKLTYDKGDTVSVFYNPEHPDRSVLEKGSNLHVIVIGIIVFIILFLRWLPLKVYYDTYKWKKRTGYKEKKRRWIEANLGKIVKSRGSLIVGEKGVVIDRNTYLMWATHDNGEDINWFDANKYCKAYKGGGHSGWRLPEVDELKNLLSVHRDAINKSKASNKDIIHLTCDRLWTFAEQDSDPFVLVLNNTIKYKMDRFDFDKIRALPVRKVRKIHHMKKQ